MKNLILTAIIVPTLLILSACSDIQDHNLVDNSSEVEFYDLTGVYRTVIEQNAVVPSVTSIQINTGISTNDASLQMFRNGLGYNEVQFFSDLDLLDSADSTFGRELSFTELRDGEISKNSVNSEGVSELDLCTTSKSLNDLLLEFYHCIEITKELDSDILDGRLMLHILDQGVELAPVEIEYSLFEKDRLSVDYFGNWSGEVTKQSNYFYDLELFSGNDFLITFQPVNVADYILRPYDVNHTVKIADETFVFEPVNRPLSELEQNANPFVNFDFVSEQDGSRRIRFNSSVVRLGRIEGNIQLILPNGSTELLATYWLEKN